MDDEVHVRRPVPSAWVEELMQEQGGTRLEFIVEKTIRRSDLSPQQNRFLIPSKAMKEHLLPLLSFNEKRKANLLGERGNRPQAERGLRVMMYIRSGWRFELKLIHWDSSDSTIFNGEEWKCVCILSSFKDQDEIELWAFRDRRGDLSFTISKKERPPLLA